MRFSATCIAAVVLLAPAVVRAQTVVGRALDATSRQPVVAATITVLDGNRVVAMTPTDSTGRFVLRIPSPGAYRIAGARVGYADATSGIVDVAADATATVELLMEAHAVQLRPVVATAARDRYLDSKGFYQRLQTGTGDFMTPEQITRRNAHTLVDLMRGMRGMKIQRVGNKNEIIFTGSTCLPMILVDGVTLRWGGRMGPTNMLQSFEDLVSVQHIEAIEAYRGGSGVPIEYVGPNAACGVILVWTRHH